DARQQMAGPVLDVGDPGGEPTTSIGGAPAGRRRRLPALLALRSAHENLQKTLRGDAVLLVGVAALEEVRVFEEVGPLTVQANRLEALAANHRLGRGHLGAGSTMRLRAPIELAP